MEQEAQYLAFIRDVWSTNELLCGPGGTFYDLKKQRGEVMTAKEVSSRSNWATCPTKHIR